MLVVSLFLLAIGLGASGCATTYAKAQYFATGEYNPKANEEVEKNFRKLQEAPPTEASAVKVMFESVPPGVKADNGVVSVEEGYPLRIVGKFTLFTSGGSPLFFADYKSTGRKALCYPQVPLTWITLGIWLLVPSSYPCWGNAMKTQDDWVANLRLLGHAAGGNLVLALRGAGGNAQGFIFSADDRYLQALSNPAPKDNKKTGTNVAKKPAGGGDV